MQRKVLNKAKLWKILGYKPSPEQLNVHSSKARFRVNVQGRRSGKSYSAAKEVLPYLLVPNNRCWVVAPTLDLANKIVREIQLDIVRNLKLPIAFKKEVSGSLHYMGGHCSPQHQKDITGYMNCGNVANQKTSQTGTLGSTHPGNHHFLRMT